METIYDSISWELCLNMLHSNRYITLRLQTTLNYVICPTQKKEHVLPRNKCLEWNSLPIEDKLNY